MAAMTASRYAPSAEVHERLASARGSTVSGFLIGFLLAALVATLVFWMVRSFESTRWIDRSRPMVVRQIQQLQRLETVVYGIDKIVAGGQESKFLPNFLAGERLLLIVYGEVTAGVDLSKLDTAAVAIGDRSIGLTLPASEIFATRIDNERTRVYSRETGLFTSADPNLESDLRREAERQIRDAALESGVLKMASDNARSTVTSFLSGLGFDRIDVKAP
jgi:hypothetical protein